MINTYFYNSLSDYENRISNKNKVNIGQINCTKLDFYRYLITAGSFKNNVVSFEGKKFYISLLNMALKENNGTFWMSDDYDNSESSIKTSISYFIGILSAYAIAEKHYKIAYLYHLKDPVISNLIGIDEKIPDFFGFKYGSYGKPVLIEAKGTSKTSLAKDTVNKAESQLKTISSFCYTDHNGSQIIKDFEKHIIGSCFKQKELNFCDIDPEYKGNKKYNFNANLGILSYYKNILSLLATNSEYIEVENVRGLEFSFINFGDFKIGINNNVLKAITSSFGDENLTIEHFFDDKHLSVIKESRLYETVTTISESDYEKFNKKFNDNSISFGRDGIIVI